MDSSIAAKIAIYMNIYNFIFKSFSFTIYLFSDSTISFECKLIN